MEEDKQPNRSDAELTMPDATKPITERSTLTISLAIALIGGLMSFTYFIAVLKSDVRTIQSDLSGIKVSIANLSRVDALQTELRELKQYGSDVSRKVSLDLIDLKRDFELHKVQTAKEGKP